MSDSAAVTATPMRQRVAEEVRVLLARRMLSASELARRIGVTQPYISRRLTGEIAFDVDDLERIAAALGVGVADLLPQQALTIVDTRPRPGSGTIAQTFRAPKQSRYGAVRTISTSTVRPARPTPPPVMTIDDGRAVRIPAA